jgi:hypothetical protein
LLFFVKNQTKIKIPVSAKEFGMGSDFERFKRNTLLPEIYDKLEIAENIKKRVFKDCKNPDVGFWTENHYIIFTPPQKSKEEQSVGKNGRFLIFTFQNLEDIKE